MAVNVHEISYFYHRNRDPSTEKDHHAAARLLTEVPVLPLALKPGSEGQGGLVQAYCYQLFENGPSPAIKILEFLAFCVRRDGGWIAIMASSRWCFSPPKSRRGGKRGHQDHQMPGRRLDELEKNAAPKKS